MEYKMLLGIGSRKPQPVLVFDSADASRLMRSFIESENFGASELHRDCGKVLDSDGKHICTICYNGRVRLPNGHFLDGMTRTDWLALCAS